MELSWSTFILEMINFLVLVWILNHFFYRPINNTILKRQKAIQDNLDKAEQLKAVAQQLQDRYDNRLKNWEQEKQDKQTAFNEELEEWKTEQRHRFEEDLEKKKKKLEAQNQQYLALMMKKNVQESMQLAGQFSSKFLSYFANQDLEEKIIDKAIFDLEHLEKDKVDLLNDSLKTRAHIEVESVYPIKNDQKKRLQALFHQYFGKDLLTDFKKNPTLLAGVTFHLGALSLQANLRDELTFFTDTYHADS